MLVRKIAAGRESLLDPDASAWERAVSETVALKGTPLRLQPSPYIKAAWKGRAIGKVREVVLAVLHNGEDVFFRLSWSDDSGDPGAGGANAFPDGAALLFPMNGDAPLLSMGTPSQPVNAWHWRADFGERGRNGIAEGLGTTRTTEQSHVVCRASWTSGAWRLVIARPLSVPDQVREAVQLAPGEDVKVGIAVWEGSNGERGGVKAFSGVWRAVEIEA